MTIPMASCPSADTVHVYEEPVVNGDTVKIGNLGWLTITGASTIEKELISITDKRLKVISICPSLKP